MIKIRKALQNRLKKFVGWVRMKYPRAYIDFLIHFHGSRDYFECHEILEDYWKLTDKNNKSSVWVGFILLAVANYHYRRNNIKGAMRTLEKALAVFHKNEKKITALGIDYNAFIETLSTQLDHMKANKQYESLQLPLADQTLIKLCQQKSAEKGFVWGSPSLLTDPHLVHRHTLRDRSGVIQERKQQLLRRKASDIQKNED